MFDKRGNKKGQVTIFIIIALIVVVAGVLIYMFYPQIKSNLGLETKNPNEFIQSCIEDEIANDIEILSLQGGSLEPEHYILNEGNKIEYLCYTNQYHQTCVVQQPLLKNHIEDEIEKEIKNSVKECFLDLKESYEKKGYSVSVKEGAINIELIPKRVVGIFNYSLTLTKGETETYDSFNVVLNNNLYELIGIANSIVDWESTYGDAETTVYMTYYHDLKVEKKKQSDGTTIYIITDRNNENKFQFASRSMAWAPGY